MTPLEYLEKYGNPSKENIERLNNGEPVQYIVGSVSFYGNIIEVDSNVLIPRFETELLVEKSIQYIKELFGNKGYLNTKHSADKGLYMESTCHLTREMLQDLECKMNEISRELVKKIDEEVEVLQKEKPQAKINELAQPVISKYAKEAGVEEIDLFIDYMDHVALASKNMALNQEGEVMFDEGELEKPDFKLY